ncbi:hypothetical protein TNCV_3899691 [Trichonephila clavipes]|nr:hypothetical protein TNCV_3899691 [Trichonephila clavipes]
MKIMIKYWVANIETLRSTGVKASQEVFEIVADDMYARTTPTRHGLTDILENIGRFSDHSSNNGYSCHQVNFRIDWHVVLNAFKDTPEKKNQGIWDAKRWDYHAQSPCLEMFDPNGHVHTFHN